MRISKKFKLGVSQYELDFVDIDTSRDQRLFVDPHFLGLRTDRWSVTAAACVQSFFTYFLALLRSGRSTEARELFAHLGEQNDTCLGLSSGLPRGSGVGKQLADDIFDSLAQSKAVSTGVLTDLEDARIFVPGVDKDRVSDMTTALIRGRLLEYTREQCTLWKMALTPDVPSGYVWDTIDRRWRSYLTPRLVISGRPILLVPKGIVSYSDQYTAAKYHRHYVLNYLKNEHLRLDTVLVQRRKRKDGTIRRWVTKKSIVDYESPGDKDYLASFTERHVEVFANFKDAAIDADSIPNEALTTEPLADVVEHLRASLRETQPGRDAAEAYHRLVAGILELCFYPALIAPTLETALHEGRKRVDIVFDNAAQQGFFHRLHAIDKLPSTYIMIECKNYSSQVSNPELDQLAGRFGVNRGQVGLLISRNIDDIAGLIRKCADANSDGRGLIIPLEDKDLDLMLRRRGEGIPDPFEDLLSERKRLIAMH